MAITTARLVRELEELIAALDRRLPQVQLAGEAAIASDAAALREKAVARLAELTGAPAVTDRRAARRSLDRGETAARPPV